MKKSEIRKTIYKIRKKNFIYNLSIDYNKFLKILDNKKDKIIGGYYPYNYEVDILDILKKLEKNKFKISLPKIEKNNLMNFYKWSFKDPLSINKFGIPEPVSKQIVNPDILLVPLLAFDNELNRLGYGGGYYDRYLAKALKNKRVKTIGISFSFQKITKVPVDQNDMKLDNIITEKHFF